MKLFDMLGEVGTEMLQDFILGIKNNLNKIATFLKFILPFEMYYYGMEKGYIISWWLILPFITWFCSTIIERLADKTGKGKNIPIPQERFTEEDEYGEVSIEQTRLQEMILYVNDVENYLERHHLM